MEVRIPADENFDFYSCKKLYKKYQKLIGDDASFNQIIKNTFFYAFYDNKTLVGCIYVFEKWLGVNESGFNSPHTKETGVGVNENSLNSAPTKEIEAGVNDNGMKLFINGFAKQGFHQFNVAAVKKIFEWFNSDIYAESIRKPAIFLLLKCGFKRVSDNLFVYYNNGIHQKGN